jgi:hypothetical protein
MNAMSHGGQFGLDIDQRYQKLCAKVAYGGASQTEFGELVEHLSSCAECRALLLDFIKTVAQALPKIARAYRPSDALTRLTDQPGAGALPQVVPGAQPSRSIPQESPRIFLPRKRIAWPSLAALAASVLLFVTSLTIYWRTQSHHDIQHANSGPAVVATNSGLDNQSGKNDELLHEVAAVTERLHTAQMRVGNLEASARADTQTISALHLEKTELLTRIAAYDGTVADLRSVAEERSAKIGQFQEQLVAREAALKAKDVELTTAAAGVAELKDRVRQEHERNAALGQLQALLAARNLHFADVHDDNPSGKGPFGRVLYAKGQSLMFYAYALADRTQLAADVSYHVWGKKGGTAQPIKSLGVLRNEDNRQGRWHLTFDDPDVLSQIDSVFVTAESDKKTRNKPSGRTILAASLSGNANHP